MYGRAPYRQPYAWFRSGSAAVLVYMRPDADSSNSGWTDQAGGTTNLALTVDEAVASDADYVRSSANPTADVIRFRVSDPASGITQPFKLSYRCSGDPSLKITARLKQGTTLIASWSHFTSSGFTTFVETLTSGEFASITDFNDLFVEFEAGP
jgi:hypothetical protein